MKNIFLPLLCACFALITFTASATILNVNNNTNNPGQYTTIVSAMSAAAVGDTLLVAGSAVSYGGFTLSKRLTIMGAGYFPVKDIAQITQFDLITITGGGADNSVLQGLQIGNITVTGSLNGFELGRCYVYSTQGGSCNFGVTINLYCYHNIFNLPFYTVSGANNIILTNNIFNNTVTFPGPILNNIIVKNNLFLGAQVTTGCHGVLFSNNIFYYRATTQNPTNIFSSTTSSVFQNNIYFNQKPNALPVGTGNNTGSGNLQADPLFKNVDLAASFAVYYYAGDYRLQPGSPAINFGTDGLDAGVYGSFAPIDYPLAGEPFIPQIKTMTILNNSLLPGGTLNVNVKAKKAN